MRGKGGGYRLNGEPDQFTVRRILEITEGSLAPCRLSRRAATRPAPAWSAAAHTRCGPGLNKLICDYLESYTIADLMRTEDAGFDYVI